MNEVKVGERHAVKGDTYMYIQVDKSSRQFFRTQFQSVIQTHRYTHVSNKIDFSVRNDKVTVRALQGTGEGTIEEISFQAFTKISH